MLLRSISASLRLLADKLTEERARFRGPEGVASQARLVTQYIVARWQSRRSHVGKLFECDGAQMAAGRGQAPRGNAMEPVAPVMRPLEMATKSNFLFQQRVAHIQLKSFN
jgi:hypothetical protein